VILVNPKNVDLSNKTDIDDIFINLNNFVTYIIVSQMMKDDVMAKIYMKIGKLLVGYF